MWWHRYAFDCLHATVSEAQERTGRMAFFDAVAFLSIRDEEEKKAIEKANEKAKKALK